MSSVSRLLRWHHDGVTVLTGIGVRGRQGREINVSPPMRKAAFSFPGDVSVYGMWQRQLPSVFEHEERRSGRVLYIVGHPREIADFPLPHAAPHDFKRILRFTENGAYYMEYRRIDSCRALARCPNNDPVLVGGVHRADQIAIPEK